MKNKKISVPGDSVARTSSNWYASSLLAAFKHSSIIILFLITGNTLLSQPITNHHSLITNHHPRLTAAYSIGATAPVPIPASIRSIDGFDLTPSFMVGADFSFFQFRNSKSSLRIGIQFENKGMDMDVTTKSYNISVKKGQNTIQGLFTGHIRQEVTQYMLTIPLTFNYQLSTFNFRVGPYLSILLHKEFTGIAYDGYLREGDPTGTRVEIGATSKDWATYDFSDNMRILQWGINLGADWQAFPRLGFSADFDCGLSGIFKSDFNTIEQTLYPLYLSLGIFYNL